MELLSRLGSRALVIAPTNLALPAQTRWSVRVGSLSLGMIILGGIRLGAAVLDILLDSSDLSLPGAGQAGGLQQGYAGNQVFYVLAAAWPLILGLMVWRTRAAALLKAAAVTFLFLALNGVLEAGTVWLQLRTPWISIGAIHLRRAFFFQPQPFAVSLGLLGAIELLAEGVVGILAAWLAIKARSSADMEPSHISPRQARHGRLAIYVSIGVLVLSIRLPIWAAYLEAAVNSQTVRDLLLRTESRRPRQFVGGLTPGEMQQARDLESLSQNAFLHMRRGEFADAVAKYREMISASETIPTNTLKAGLRQSITLALNNLAWLLATCPDEKIRDPQASVMYAERAVELGPKSGNSWNTLGVAYYRAGRWEDSKDALYRSMELRMNRGADGKPTEGDSFDWFFLSLVHLKLGDAKRAREWYDRAAEWYLHNLPDNPELYQFQVEACATLGLPKPTQPAPDPNAHRYVEMPVRLHGRFRNQSSGLSIFGGREHATTPHPSAAQDSDAGESSKRDPRAAGEGAAGADARDAGPPRDRRHG